MVVKLQSTLSSVEVPVKVTKFSVFIYFSVRDFISSHKDKTWDCRTDNIWSLLPLLCICWWYNFFLKGCHFYKKYGRYFPLFFGFLWIKTKFMKMWDYRYWSPERGSSGSLRYVLRRSKNDILKILGTHFSYNEKLKE